MRKAMPRIIDISDVVGFMTWFSKPKRPERRAPETCGRCRQAQGVMHVFTMDPAKTGASAAPDGMWVCAACLAEISRSAPEN